MSMGQSVEWHANRHAAIMSTLTINFFLIDCPNYMLSNFHLNALAFGLL